MSYKWYLTINIIDSKLCSLSKIKFDITLHNEASDLKGISKIKKMKYFEFEVNVLAFHFTTSNTRTLRRDATRRRLNAAV